MRLTLQMRFLLAGCVLVAATLLSGFWSALTFARLRAATNLEITAAGGITTLDDIRALERLHIHSAVGMAIYTGKLDLAELAALSVA